MDSVVNNANTSQDHTHNSGANLDVSVFESLPILDFDFGPQPPAYHVFQAPTVAGRTPRFSQALLRRRLWRVEHKPINMNNVLSVDPNLKDVPLSLLIEKTATIGTEYLKSMDSVKIANRILFSYDIEVIVNDDTKLIPSHVIRVLKGPVTDEFFGHFSKNFPAFDLVLTINCAHMPVLPPANPIPQHVQDSPGEQRVALPLVEIVVPASGSFETLYTYLYSKDTQQLIRALFPVKPTPPAMIEDDPNEIIPFATRLAKTFTADTLLKAAAHVFGLWNNVCALGISDERLWLKAMDLVWEILVTALDISHGTTRWMVPDWELEEPSAAAILAGLGIDINDDDCQLQ